MIRVTDLTKVFERSRKELKKNKGLEKRVTAVNRVSFHVQPGEIYALLGPNGAGKTTALRCVATLLSPTSGNVEVSGFDSKKDPRLIRERIGFLTNELKLDDHFTPAYTMRFFGQLRGMSLEAIEQRQQTLFSRFGVASFKDKQITDLSTGMKQKLAIAVSLLHDPEVIIFDEPTNGLDIITARTVLDYLMEMRSLGKSIIISTHVMRVAEELSDRIGILIDGKLLAEGSLDEILQNSGSEGLEQAFFSLYERAGVRDA